MPRLTRRHATIAALVLAAGLAGCGTTRFGETEPAAVPVAPAALPSQYQPEEVIGRWGFTSFHNAGDRARTEVAARGQCRQPYVIARGPTGGVMMHLADQREPRELRLKGGPGGKNYIGVAEEPPGAASDREIVSFDGRVMVTRYVDPDAGNRYGNMVYVRCAPRA